MRALLVALQIAAAQPQAQLSPAPPQDSVRLRAAVDSAVLSFLMDWRDAWEETQSDHASKSFRDDYDAGDRLAVAAHCHYDAISARLRKYMIRGRVVSQAVCPVWYPGDSANVPDERHDVDLGLSEDRRASIRALRRGVRHLLDSAATRLPGDVHIAGQRVRFALDDADTTGAMSAAQSCTGAAAQCGLLRALVLYRSRRENVAASDSAFLAAERFMSDSARCAWDDVGVLLEPDGRRRYEQMTCAQRDTVNRNLWWLSDPLWSEPGNERRAEHDARKALVEVLAALHEDGRQRFTPRKGGEAVIESLIRYGWPSQMFWGGWSLDEGHDTWLPLHGADTAPPYVVREYTRGRLHVVPSWPAVLRPLASTADAWQLNAPRGDDDWWPAEHYARDLGGIVQLADGQSVMLRRHDSTVFVWAADVDDSIARPCAADASCRATLYDSRAPGDLRAVASFGVQRDSRLIVRAPLPAGATLVGIELPAAPGRSAARTRYAVRVLDPLSALAGARALSQPLLFDPPGDASPPLDDRSAVSRMYGTTALERRRVGVYWEAYGFGADDTLDVQVRITREDRPNALQRLAHLFGLGSTPGGSVSIRWREVPGTSRAVRRMEGNVPVEMRSVVVDLSRLPRGHYRLQLSMADPTGPAVTSERAFQLR